jgi:hypothetical protein
MIPTDTGFGKILEDAVCGAIKKEIDREVERAVSEAKSKIESRIPEIVSGVAIYLHKRIAYEFHGESITITIDDRRQ